MAGDVGPRSRFTVRFGDVDTAGIVYYPRIPHYFHVAMEEAFGRDLGLPYAQLINEQKRGLPAVRLEVDYRRPLAYGDEIEAEARILDLGRTSVTWRFRLYKSNGELAVEGRVVTVWMDLERFGKEELPAELRRKLEGLKVERGSRAGVGPAPPPARDRPRHQP
ncbi:MAG: acyl-CoA thioesterase [Acidobacteriota bacterium]